MIRKKLFAIGIATVLTASLLLLAGCSICGGGSSDSGYDTYDDYDDEIYDRANEFGVPVDDVYGVINDVAGAMH